MKNTGRETIRKYISRINFRSNLIRPFAENVQSEIHDSYELCAQRFENKNSHSRPKPRNE